MALINFTLLVFLCLFANSAVAQRINYLIIGGEVAPLQFESKGIPTKQGIISEIVFKIFEKSEYQVNLKMRPWKRQIDEIEKHKIKNWLIYAIPSWLNFNASFSEELFEWRHVLVSHKNTVFSLSNPDSLGDKVLVLINHFDYPGLDSWSLKNRFKSITYAASNKSAMTILNKRWGQVFIGEVGRTNFSIHELGYNLNNYKFEDFSSVIKTSNIVLAFDPGMSEKFRSFVNKRIRKLKTDGEIEAILRNYKWIHEESFSSK